jgi:hypothetical protein
LVGLVVVVGAGVGLGFGVDGGDDSGVVGLGAGADDDFWVGAGAGALLDELCVAGGVLLVVPPLGVVPVPVAVGDWLADA